MGLRELKKEKSRKMISDVATALFIERGYHEVSIADVAAASEVSVSTVFNYFKTKEALVFDVEEQIEQEMIAAVRNRDVKNSILQTLHHYFLNSKMMNPPSKKDYAKFNRLVTTTPELHSYFRLAWSRYAVSLSKEIRSADKVGKSEADCIAQMILDGAFAAINSSNPKEALKTTFQILENGWKPKGR